MKYTSTQAARFIKRPNRFIAQVQIGGPEGPEELVHVKNTGRCKEILLEGNTVILEKSQNPERKTKYSMIAAYKGDLLINIDSQVPNAVVYEAIQEGKIKEIQNVTTLKREMIYGNSRFDVYFEANGQQGFIEVKGVTLENEGIAMFPDAPTQRGCKHVYEMIKAVEDGYLGFIFFLIQMKGMKHFTPFEERDPALAKALRLASEKGVTILAYDSIVTEDEIIIGNAVDVQLS